MRAWVIRSIGGLERVELAQVPDPASTLRATEVRAVLRAAHVQHPDTFSVRCLPARGAFPAHPVR